MKNNLKSILMVGSLAFASVTHAFAQSAPEDASAAQPTILQSPLDSWDYTATVWGWMPGVKGDTFAGPTVKLSLKDILKNLKFIAFGAFQADKGKLSLQTDGLYMKLKGDAGNRATLEMQAVVFNLGAAYAVYENPTTKLSAYGGARYLWIKDTLDFDGPVLNFKTSFKDDNLDGVIGFRGRTVVNEKWYATYFADAGTGQSDFVWQAGATMNYKFEKFDAFFGYRHMHWNFDKSFTGFKNLQISGPVVGARIGF